MSGPKPVLLGYQNNRVGTPDIDLARGRLQLETFARREGYALGEIYVEADMDAPCSAMAAIITAAQAPDVKAIAVPTAWDLGSMPRVQSDTRQRIERESGVQVMIVFVR